MKGTNVASTRPAWQALVTHHAQIGGKHLRELFAADPERRTRWTVGAAGLYLDYSKNRVDDETVALLAALARDRGLHERIAELAGTAPPAHDSSTNALIQRYRQLREERP